MKAVTALAIVLVLMSALSFGRAQDQTHDYAVSFQLLNHPDGDMSYQLNVTIPQSLYDYYLSKSHSLATPDDFAKFVTPYALQPIADRLWQIYNNTEDFTNGVLMLVHQINYYEVIQGRYPVETLVADRGDCDLFAYIAASILEAGGINTVILYYKDQLHMELGVDLGAAPVEARTSIYDATYDNVSYYIAECTGGQWRDGWRVGECPSNYSDISAQVITLENREQSSMGQVSASLAELQPSTLTLQASTTFTLENSPITLTGQILPPLANENVTLQAQITGQPWINIGSTLTQADGKFVYTWVPPPGGAMTLQASWLGNKQYNGAKSAETKMTVLPLFVVAATAGAAVAVGLVTFAFARTRRKKPEPPQPSIPQDTQPTEPPPPAPPENAPTAVPTEEKAPEQQQLPNLPNEEQSTVTENK